MAGRSDYEGRLVSRGVPFARARRGRVSDRDRYPLSNLERTWNDPRSNRPDSAGVIPSVVSRNSGEFSHYKSKGAEGQTRITAQPDEHWSPKESIVLNNDLYEQQVHPKTEKLLQKAGYLLITAGQDNSTARLTAVASDQKYVGNGWMPVSGLTVAQAKAAAVCLNSTFGRLQLMRSPGRKLAFPSYSVKEAERIRIPNLTDAQICRTLAQCWEATTENTVPQFRDGECEVRRLWDDAVAEVLDWDAAWLADLRYLLHKEPYVRGLGYDQFGEECATDV